MGYRYTYDKRRLTVSPTRPQTGNCLFDLDLLAPGIQSTPISQCFFSDSVTARKSTYDATLQWEPSNQITAYASYRHGFRAGGLNARATNYPAFPFGPEQVDEYEIGLKTNVRLGEIRWTTSTALYHQDYKDVQKSRGSAFDANGDGVSDTVLTLFDNLANQRNRGAEVEGALHFPAGLMLSGYFSYTDIKVKRGIVISNGFVEDPMRGVSRYTAGGSASYDLPIPQEMGEAFVSATWAWRSRTHYDDFGPFGFQKAYSLFNARAEWSNIQGSSISISAFVNNLTNKLYRIGGFGGLDVGFGFFSAVYGEPRTYGLEVGFEF